MGTLDSEALPHPGRTPRGLQLVPPGTCSRISGTGSSHQVSQPFLRSLGLERGRGGLIWIHSYPKSTALQVLFKLGWVFRIPATVPPEQVLDKGHQPIRMDLGWCAQSGRSS